MKAPLPFIKARGAKTFLVMNEIVSVWMAPDFLSPNNFNERVVSLTTLDNTLADKEALQTAAAGAFDATLEAWHEETVLALKMGRLAFADTDKAHLWSTLTANGGGRDRITREGRDLESAWKASDPTWKPKPTLTLAVFQAHRTLSTTRQDAFNTADNNADIARAALHLQADYVYDLCVTWYEMATANFGLDTVEGELIRTIPTTYNPNQAPGQLQFPEYLSPAPNQMKLVWTAARGEHFNIYAKAPGATEFTKFLDNVTFTHWMGEGVMAGPWSFRGEALNESGAGELSGIVTIPVLAANAA